MKKSLVCMVLAIATAIASSAQAQWFRFGNCANGSCGRNYYSQSCANGRCGSYAYSPYYSSTCANGKCGTTAQPSCTTGQCGTTCQNGSCKLEQPSCTTGSCSIQSETSTYDLADKIEVTYTRASVKCQECGVLLSFPINENAIWECVKCRRQYATKDGALYNIVKKNNDGYLTRNGESIPGCTSAECAAKTDISIQKKLATPVASLINSINAVRARYGLAALASNSSLESGALRQASYCSRIGYLQHASGVAEILAQNNQGLETAINQWLNSPGHRALLLNGSFRYAGVAVVRDNYGRVWCAVQFR